MTSNRLLGMIAAVAFAMSAVRTVHAQVESDGPTALIVTYHAKPGMRAKFRSIMATDGVAQLDHWRNEGVFASYRALFTAYAADSVPDLYLIVRFHHFTDLARWQKIEMMNPGGLPAKAQDLASADTSAIADIVKEATGASTTTDSQFFVLEYDVTVDMPKYISYVQGYVAPQFDGWMKTGALSSYASFVNQNPAGAPWSSFILLEYKDLKALSTREVIKTNTRKELAVSDPVWKKWSDDKTSIRKEKAAIAALSLR